MRKTFTLPDWCKWFVPKATQADLERRASLTGTARQTRTYWFGTVEIEVQQVDKPDGEAA